MTKARVFRSGTDRRGRSTFFIDGRRVKETRFRESTRKSRDIKSQIRDRLGRVGERPAVLRPRPKPLVVERVERPLRRFVGRIRSRPRVGRVGDEYAIVTLEVESDHDPSDDEWFALANAVTPDLVAFFVKDSRELGPA